MKRERLSGLRLFCLFFLLLFLYPVTSYSQEELEISGSISLDKRFVISDWWASNPDATTPQVGFYSKADIRMQRWLGDDLRVVISGQLRVFDHSSVTTVEGMNNPGQQMEYQFLPWEIFIEAHGVFLDGLDLKLGKQRIAWGKADKLNPTDTLNPDDFTDIFNFGAHVPSTAALATYAFPNDVSITAVWLPVMRPVLTSYAYPQVEQMVTGRQQKVLMGGLPPGLTSGFDLSTLPMTDRVVQPEFDLRHSMQAVRLDGSLLGVDLSLSYFHGYEDIPVVRKVTVQLAPVASIDTELGFMPFHQVGADLATDLGGVGVWVEAALVMPEGVSTSIEPLMSEKIQTVSDKPFAKFTIGGDYTFPGGFYVNLQYAHGLAHEIDKDSLGEYVVGRIQKKLMGEKLLLALNGGFATPDWLDVSDQYGFLVNPEVMYKPFDNFELGVGLFIVEGQGDESLFSGLDSADQLYLKATASF